MKATVHNVFINTNWEKAKSTIQKGGNHKMYLILGFLYPVYQKQNSYIFLAHHNNKLNQ